MMSIIKIVFGFFSDYWKYILPALALVGVWFWYNGQINAAEDRGLIEGRAIEKAEWVARVEQENKDNRALESKLVTTLETAAARLIENQKIRVVKEEVLVKEIQTIIRENPVYEQCLINDQVLTFRNDIRKLGPTTSELQDD